MIGEVAEGIITFIFEIIFRLIVEITFYFTGELVLFFITFGKKRIKWNLFSDESEKTKWMLLTDLSVIIGFIFWITLIILITN